MHKCESRIPGLRWLALTLLGKWCVAMVCFTEAIENRFTHARLMIIWWICWFWSTGKGGCTNERTLCETKVQISRTMIEVQKVLEWGMQQHSDSSWLPFQWSGICCECISACALKQFEVNLAICCQQNPWNMLCWSQRELKHVPNETAVMSH